MRTAARAAGAVIPGALVRMSGVVGFHVEDDDLMAQEDSLGLQLGVMNLFDLLTLTTRLRQRGDPRPAMGSSPFTTLPKPATALGTRSFSTTSSSARNESTTSGIAAASAGFAAAACAFNCTVLPVLSAALPALGGAASASCDASVLGVSVSTLKAATVSPRSAGSARQRAFFVGPVLSATRGSLPLPFPATCPAQRLAQQPPRPLGPHRSLVAVLRRGAARRLRRLAVVQAAPLTRRRSARLAGGGVRRRRERPGLGSPRARGCHARRHRSHAVADRAGGRTRRRCDHGGPLRGCPPGHGAPQRQVLLLVQVTAAPSRRA